MAAKSQGFSAENCSQNPVGYNGGQQNNIAEASRGEPQTRIRWEDIEVVKTLIERCMRLYLNKDQVVEALRVVPRIEPKLARMVWDKLEQDNPQFFKAYYTRVVLCRQISSFNRLLKAQQGNLAGNYIQRASVVPQAESSTASNCSLTAYAPMDGNMPGGPPDVRTNRNQSNEGSPESVGNKNRSNYNDSPVSMDTPKGPAGYSHGMKGSIKKVLKLLALPGRESNATDQLLYWPGANFTTSLPKSDVVLGSNFGTGYESQLPEGNPQWKCNTFKSATF